MQQAEGQLLPVEGDVRAEAEGGRGGGGEAEGEEEGGGARPEGEETPWGGNVPHLQGKTHSGSQTQVREAAGFEPGH